MIFNIPDNQNHIAVALSGGGDSIALAHMMCVWASGNQRHIHLLTVNHNLRPEAAEEAAHILNWVKDFPASSHHILTWDYDDKPETAIMEKAREARYALMADYCNTNAIKTLAIAHHADDQLETFLFRLAKGSGLDGLTGMEEWREFNGVNLYRPLLTLSHNDLIEYCKNNNLQWVEDPSNKNMDYARPRLRQALEDEGLDAKRFAKTLARLNRGKQALNNIAESVLNDNLTKNGLNWMDVKKYPLDIQIRVVQMHLLTIGQTARNYPPKLERLEEIVSGLQEGKSATLYGCVLSLSKDGNTLEIKASKA